MCWIPSPACPRMEIELINIVGYLGEQIEAHIRSNYPHIKAHYVVQDDPRGQSHAIYLAALPAQRTDADGLRRYAHRDRPHLPGDGEEPGGDLGEARCRPAPLWRGGDQHRRIVCSA